MASFEWHCKECELVWERDCEIGKAPKRTKCPECNKMSDRFFGEVNFSFKDDGCGNKDSGASDFWAVKQRYKKHAQQGFDKDSANTFLKRSIEETKSRLNDESFRYKPANFNYDNLERDGKVRRLRDNEAKDKMERAKKLTGEAYDKANRMGYKDAGKDKLDISKPQKQF